jgi:hypothetical protein
MIGDVIVHVEVDTRVLRRQLADWQEALVALNMLHGPGHYGDDTIPELVKGIVHHTAQAAVKKSDFNFNDIPGDMEEPYALS